MAKTKVVMILRGGMVEEVLSDKDVDVVVLDRDVDGVDEEKIQEVKHGNDFLRVRVECPQVQKKAIKVDSLINQVVI